MRKGKRLPEFRVDDAEDARHRGDAARECDAGREQKRRFAAERAQAEGEVAPEMIQRRDRPHVPGVLVRERRVTHDAPALGSRVIGLVRFGGHADTVSEHSC